MKPDPVIIEIFVEDAEIKGFIRQGDITMGGQTFDINARQSRNKRWPIGHIAWQVGVDSNCIAKLKDLTKDYTESKTAEVKDFKDRQNTQKTNLNNDITKLNNENTQLTLLINNANTAIRNLRNQIGRNPREREELRQAISILSGRIDGYRQKIEQNNRLLFALNGQLSEVQRDIDEAGRRSHPEQNNAHRVGFGAASLVEFKQAEKVISESPGYMIEVETPSGKKENRKKFDVLTVQGRLCDDNQGQNKNEQTNADFYKKN
ncbi:MAG: hypothetical protein LBC74_12400 [Planctomycetaceae bacterium]|nr:hypothetical protein [Planctomycetaceae bacterium]